MTRKSIFVLLIALSIASLSFASDEDMHTDKALMNVQPMKGDRVVEKDEPVEAASSDSIEPAKPSADDDDAVKGDVASMDDAPADDAPADDAPADDAPADDAPAPDDNNEAASGGNDDDVERPEEEMTMKDRYGDWWRNHDKDYVNENRGFCMFWRNKNGGYWKLALCSEGTVDIVRRGREYKGMKFSAFGSRSGVASESASLVQMHMLGRLTIEVTEIDSNRGIWTHQDQKKQTQKFYCRGDRDGVYVNTSAKTKLLSCSEADEEPLSLPRAAQNLCLEEGVLDSAEAERALCKKHNEIVKGTGKPRRLFVVRPTGGESAAEKCEKNEELFALDYTDYKFDFTSTDFTKKCPGREQVSAGYSVFMGAEADDEADGEADPADFKHMYICVNKKTLVVRPIHSVSSSEKAGSPLESRSIMDFQFEIQSKMNMNCIRQYRAMSIMETTKPINLDKYICKNDRTGRRPCLCDSMESCCCYKDIFDREVFRLRPGYSTVNLPGSKHAGVVAKAGEQAYCTPFAFCKDARWW